MSGVYRGGWVGGGGRVGGKLKEDYSFHQDTGSSTVLSARDRNRRNPQDRQISCSLAPLTSYQCHLETTQALQCTVVDLQGWQKAFCESRLSSLQPCTGTYGWHQSVGFMLGNKMDFSSCTIWITFYKSSHIWYQNENTMQLILMGLLPPELKPVNQIS